MLPLTRRSALRGLASSIGLTLLTACTATPQAAPPAATAPAKPVGMTTAATGSTSAPAQSAAATAPAAAQPTASISVTSPPKPATAQPQLSFTMPISTNPITLLTTKKVHDIDFLMHIGALGFTNTWLDA